MHVLLKKKKNPNISGSNKTWQIGLHEIKMLYKVKKSLQIGRKSLPTTHLAGEYLELIKKKLKKN